MVQSKKDLWSLTRNQPYVDPTELTLAIEQQIVANDLDYRSRLLIRDSVEALQDYWGAERLGAWLTQSPVREQIQSIRGEAFERVGFPTLRKRLMAATKPEEIERFLRELGTKVRARKPVRIAVGGSVALILTGYLTRGTEDIDVVDEVPAEIRAQHQALEQMKADYGIYVAHFQSHYLPMRWETRQHYHGRYGDLEVYLVDVLDVFLSKLFSRRDKDLVDLRLLASKVDKDAIARRMNADMQSYLATDAMRERAAQNWYILYGEKLPHEQQPPSQPAPGA